MQAYIEAAGGTGVWRLKLEDDHLREIGEFTKENILAWYERYRRTDVSAPNGKDPLILYHMDELPQEDFHAVNGDIDIPWAKEELRKKYKEATRKQ